MVDMSSSHMHRRFKRPVIAPALLVCAALAGGCSTPDIPRLDNYPATGQKTSRAVHHWDVLADDVASRIANKISDWPAGEHPIYVSMANDSNFNRGFHKLLVVRLLDRGVVLSTNPTAVDLTVEAQLVQHNAASSSRPWTRLAAGIDVARDSVVQAPDAATSVAGGSARTEVLITTALKSGDRYLAGSADVYYIDGGDALLYQTPLPPPLPTPVKTWKVVTP